MHLIGVIASVHQSSLRQTSMPDAAGFVSRVLERNGQNWPDIIPVAIGK
jgi:hypothetical protein